MTNIRDTLSEKVRARALWQVGVYSNGKATFISCKILAGFKDHLGRFDPRTRPLALPPVLSPKLEARRNGGRTGLHCFKIKRNETL